MRMRRRSFTLEPLESRRLLATVTVNTVNDNNIRDSSLTLREAILVVNGTLSISSLSTQEQASVSGQLSSTNSIAFNIPGSGLKTIAPTSALPAITTSVSIDGYTQPGTSENTASVGSNAVLLIELSGINAGPTADGLFLSGLSASNSTIRGLAINTWGIGRTTSGQAGGRGIVVSQSGGGNRISGNFIGTDPTGKFGLPNYVGGIQLDNTIDDTIGGTSLADRNIILVGTNPNDTAHTTMWGLYASGASQSTIEGNYFGVNASGVQFPNFNAPSGVYGVTLLDSTGVIIGGADTNTGNVVTSVWIGTLSGTVVPANNFVAGNTIGLNAAKTLPLTGQAGVIILNSAGNIIGGNTPAAGNFIAAVDSVGIDVIADNHAANLSTLITGNTIGSIPPTSTPFHQFTGIRVSSSGNTIGGLNAAAANTIAHNTSYGIQVFNNPAGTTSTSGFGLATNNKFLSNVINDSGKAPIAPNDQAATTPIAKLVSATPTGTNTILTGVLPRVTPGATYFIQFYADLNASSAYGPEAERLLTTERFVADNNGVIFFKTIVDGRRIPSGSTITVSATGSSGNTSQFSDGVPIGSPVSSQILLNVTNGTPTVGQPVTIRAVVASDAANWYTPTGKTVFYDNGAPLAVVDVASNGTATYTIPSLSSGGHVITVAYSGDTIFPGATSAGLSINGGQVAAPRVSSIQRTYLSDSQVVIQITFDSPIDPNTANRLANYDFVALRQQGTGYVATGSNFGVTSASYNSSTRTVTITPSVFLNRTVMYAITVVGTSPSGIANTSGQLLDGSGNGTSGTNYYSRI